MRRAVVTLALLALAAPAAMRGDKYPLERHDVLSREFTLPAGSPRSVLVDNVFGAVKVRAGGGDRVTIEIRREVRARREDDLREGFDVVRFASRVDGGRLELGQDGPFRCGSWGSGDRHWGSCDWDPDYVVRWDWQVTLPADVDLEVRTVNDGDLDVDGVRGAVAARNVNGEIRLSGLAATVDARTVNGKVHADYAAVPSREAKFETVNGDIEVTLPEASGAELGFETMNGEIYTDFEVSAVPQRARSIRDERHGNRYKLDRDTVVRIGAGGPRLDCKTLNGDIVVRAR